MERLNGWYVTLCGLMESYESIIYIYIYIYIYMHINLLLQFWKPCLGDGAVRPDGFVLPLADSIIFENECSKLLIFLNFWNEVLSEYICYIKYMNWILGNWNVQTYLVSVIVPSVQMGSSSPSLTANRPFSFNSLSRATCLRNQCGQWLERLCRSIK
jgi:hypothetical protein